MALSKERMTVPWWIESGIYHVLFRAFELIGKADTWGKNTEIHTEYVRKIPEEIRHKLPFRVLLLGSASKTSIKQLLQTTRSWKEQRLVSKTELTVIDLSRRAFNQLDSGLHQEFKFVQTDTRALPFKRNSFDFISSDYLFNFIPRDQLHQTIKGLAELLNPGGVVNGAVVVNWRPGGNQLTKEELDKMIPEDCEWLPSFMAKGENGGIVWGFQKRFDKSKSVEQPTVPVPAL